MKRTNKYLDNLVTKIINETLEEKADQVMVKLGGSDDFDYVAEGETCECGSKEFYEGMCVECGTMKGEVLEKECMECGPGYMEEDTNQLELDEFEDEDWLRVTDEIAKELDIPLTLNKTWVDPDDMWLHQPQDNSKNFMFPNNLKI